MKHNHSAAEWRTSTFSDGLQCVEVAAVGDQVAVRHSKDPGGEVLSLTRQEFGAWLDGVRAGEFDDLA